jgi:hypothetical protein
MHQCQPTHFQKIWGITVAQYRVTQNPQPRFVTVAANKIHGCLERAENIPLQYNNQGSDCGSLTNLGL